MAIRKIKKPPDLSGIIKYDKYLTSYKCVKTSLKSIVKDKNTVKVTKNMYHKKDDTFN
jgi:hypothetical protein